MILNEIAENIVLEEASNAGEELTPEEVQSMLERERQNDPPVETTSLEKVGTAESLAGFDTSSEGDTIAPTTADEGPKPETDPFDEIDYGSFFDEYLDPGFKSPASETVEKPSFETFLSSPVTLSDHLQSQLSVMVLKDSVRDAANGIIGNLEEGGYLTTPLEEIAAAEGLNLEDAECGLRAVQSLDPTGVGATSIQECLLLQLEARGSRDSVAWKIVKDHLKLLETRQVSLLARAMNRPLEHIQIALNVIRHLDPAPGLRYSSGGPRQVEPDVYISQRRGRLRHHAERRRNSPASVEWRL